MPELLDIFKRRSTPQTTPKSPAPPKPAPAQAIVENPLRDKLKDMALHNRGYLPGYATPTQKEIEEARPLLRPPDMSRDTLYSTQTVRLNNGPSKGKSISFKLLPKKTHNPIKGWRTVGEWSATPVEHQDFGK